MKQSLHLGMKAQQRLALLGRLRMAEWIEMPEREFAKQIEDLEKDSLFKKLLTGSPAAPSVIRRQRWPSGRLAGSFYEVNEATMARGESVEVERLLKERKGLLAKITRMGREAFERYFLYGDEVASLDEISRRTGLSVEDIREIHDFLLEVGSQSEFFLPAREPGIDKSFTCLARVSVQEGGPEFEFYSPYWARGAYQVRYDLLEDMKVAGSLAGDERKRLRHLLKRVETVNLRQNTVFRILESLTKLQGDYLRTRRYDRLRPISLRLLAHRLQLAPSTVSRAISGRSMNLPWGKEVPLSYLLPGSRKVVRDIVGQWLEGGERMTDAAAASRLKSEYGIALSRRTLNAVRHELTRKG